MDPIKLGSYMLSDDLNCNVKNWKIFEEYVAFNIGPNYIKITKFIRIDFFCLIIIYQNSVLSILSG